MKPEDRRHELREGLRQPVSSRDMDALVLHR
jgi:hypothetical protein